jgi:large subunit ribosomal protein L15
MRQHELTLTHHKPTAKRVGRGIAAGGGKTAGRGTKGQKSRTGANSNIPRTFEGGATSLIQRLPKRKGFTSHRIRPVTLNAVRLEALFKSDEPITALNLIEFGLISETELGRGIKVVGPHAQFTFDTTDERLSFSNAAPKTDEKES